MHIQEETMVENMVAKREVDARKMEALYFYERARAALPGTVFVYQSRVLRDFKSGASEFEYAPKPDDDSAGPPKHQKIAAALSVDGVVDLLQRKPGPDPSYTEYLAIVREGGA